MKKVIYTVLVGGYDKLLQPLATDESYDYVCFCDNPMSQRAGIWELRDIPYRDAKGDNTRTSRFPKLLPHKVLAEYDYSLYIDANIQITSSYIYNKIEERIKENVQIAQVPNTFRDSVYQDIRIAYRLGKVSLREARRQMQHLREEGFPEHYGLYENNVILRRHNDPFVVNISNAWWQEYNAYSHRDQFSLMYVYWKYIFKPNYLIDEQHNARNCDCMRLVKHPHREGMWKTYIKLRSGMRKPVASLILR